MRFPDAQMVQIYSSFSSLGLKEANAKIKIEPWNSSAGAKRELQVAWFRVKGIPIDQRAVKTIAKIGVLVGKVLAIDERCRSRSNFVRIKLACRDVSRVPAVAESTLGLRIYDFSFEREVEESSSNDTLRAGEKIGDPSNQSSSKKPRMEEPRVDKDKNLMGSELGHGRFYAGSHSAPSKTHNVTDAIIGEKGKGKNIVVNTKGHMG